MNDDDITGYSYTHAELNQSHDALLPAVLRHLDDLSLSVKEKRLFELGCGNGSVSHELTRRGWNVTGVDPSVEGIQQARVTYPDLKLQNGSAYDDLSGKYGQFPVVLSLEVVEHVYAPRDYARTTFGLLSGGGARRSFRRPTMVTGRTWRWR
jgi:2-polyprenyl-3-methyl-5-hydroxy-6-metoxy-1,4-benzoquinol methylase